MNEHPLKSGRIPFEIICQGQTIQLTASGRELSLRIVGNPADEGQLEAALGLHDCVQQKIVHPACFRAYRLSRRQWAVTKQELMRLGIEVVHWGRPSD